jgi:uncharacterized membrane protein
MTKHRLELFSDGVFAIVLTLLVLDLRVPAAHGFQALAEIAPELLVHAGTFAIVGILWMVHHSGLARVGEISSKTLVWNLVALFWVTLLPFAAKDAAAHPLEPLGACLIAAACGGFMAALVTMRLSAHSSIDANPDMKAWRRGRIVIGLSVAAGDFTGAALSWLTPWAGYAAALATVVLLIALPSPPDAEDRVLRNAG